MGKFKSKNFVIDLIIYPFNLMVSIGESDELLFKTISQKYHNVEPDCMERIASEVNCNGRHILFTETRLCVIRLNEFRKNNEDYKTLQHEISHVVYNVLDDIGIRLVIGVSEEAYTYLTGFITKEIYDRL